MPKLLVFQHVAHEILGTLDPLLRNSGIRIRYVNFGRSNYEIPDLKNYDGLIVLGGHMNVDQVEEYPYLIPEIEAIGEAITLDIPILGICLGSQLLAKALGGEVSKNNTKEIGWYDVKFNREVTENLLGEKIILLYLTDSFTHCNNRPHLKNHSFMWRAGISYFKDFFHYFSRRLSYS